jgi:hypothetical protein
MARWFPLVLICGQDVATTDYVSQLTRWILAAEYEVVQFVTLANQSCFNHAIARIINSPDVYNPESLFPQ